MLISTVPASDKLVTLTTGSYKVDAPVAQSPMPGNVPADPITFTPDSAPSA